jgi:lipopolysaccharide biosynthesis glycosyltransferase
MKTTNLIFTQSSGIEFNAFCEYTVPLMQAYADNVGADFRYEKSEERTEYPLFDKYKMYDLLNTNDRILFLDCDILVRSDAPNLFNLVPEGHFAALNEGSQLDDLEKLRIRATQLYEAGAAFGYNASHIDVSSRYFNAGVMLVDKSHRDLFKMPEPNAYMSANMTEQSLLNLRLHATKTKTYSLPLCFNCMPRWWSTVYWEDNYFIHYAGIKHGLRYDAIMRDYDRITTSESCTFN